MQWTIVQLSSKPQMSKNRSSTLCLVVERPGHHCGDDLVGKMFCRPALFVAVHHKVSDSNISRKVCSRITKFYKTVHTDLVFNNTGNDATNWSEVMWKKNCRNFFARRLGSNFLKMVQAMITKLYMLIGDSRSHKLAGYDLTSYYRSAVKCI